MNHDNQNINGGSFLSFWCRKNYNYKKIQQKFSSFKISVSHTTRKPRLNEVNGVDYNFVSQEIFEKLIKEKKFYEYAKIFDNYYGTLKDTVDKLIKTNDVIFDIDWQGTKQLSKFKNLNLIKIFISIIDKKELRMRLVKRNQDSTTEVEKDLNLMMKILNTGLIMITLLLIKI